MQEATFGDWEATFGDWEATFGDWEATFGDWEATFGDWEATSGVIFFISAPECGKTAGHLILSQTCCGT